MLPSLVCDGAGVSVEGLVMWFFILHAGFCFWVVSLQKGVSEGPATKSHLGQLCLGLPRADRLTLSTSLHKRGSHHQPTSMEAVHRVSVEQSVQRHHLLRPAGSARVRVIFPSKKSLRPSCGRAPAGWLVHAALPLPPHTTPLPCLCCRTLPPNQRTFCPTGP